MIKDKFELSVLVNGKPIREYFHNGRFFIEAKNKTEYSLKLKNHSHKKILAVISVDGVEVLHGGKAADTSSGYVVNPFSTLNVNGYRIDDNNVATFKFTSGQETGDAPSYASLVENNFDEVKAYANPSKNNGVIGVRIWEEKEGKFIPAWENKHNDKSNFYNHTYPVHCNMSGHVGTGIAIGNFTGSLIISGCGNINPFRNYDPNSTVNLFAFSGSANVVPGPGSGASISNNTVAFQSYFNSSSNFCTTGCATSVARTDVNQMGSLDKIQTLSLDPNYVPNFDLGTAWGKKIEDKVIKTKFEKSDVCTDLEIFYLTREELIKMGVDVENAKKVFVSGFPKAFGTTEYCKQPSDWSK